MYKYVKYFWTKCKDIEDELVCLDVLFVINIVGLLLGFSFAFCCFEVGKCTNTEEHDHRRPFPWSHLAFSSRKV